MRIRPAQEELVRYAVTVGGWDCYYSQRGTDPKIRWEDALFAEHTSLAFTGTLKIPEAGRFKTAEITLYCEHRRLEQEREETDGRRVAGRSGR